MEILNTTGGGFSVGSIVAAVLFGLLAVAAIVLAFMAAADREVVVMFVGLICAAGAALVSIINAFDREPVRHEVILHDGATIDATKYNVVEQRGKIYVIEEREASK